jgi:hypothetical protein
VTALTAVQHEDINLSDAVITDSGSGGSFNNNWARYKSVNRLEEPFKVTSGGVETLIRYQGVMRVIVERPESRPLVLEVPDAYYWPDLHTSVIAHSRLNKNGFFFNDRERLYTNGKTTFKVEPFNGIFVADKGHFKRASPPNNINTMAAAHRLRIPFSTTDEATWHRRLGHPGQSRMETILAQAEGIRISAPRTQECHICAQSKAKKIEWRDPQPARVSSPFGHVCWDLFEYGLALGRPGRHLSIRRCPVTGFIFTGTPAGRGADALWAEVEYFDLFLQRQYGIHIRYWQCDNERGIVGGVS